MTKEIASRSFQALALPRNPVKPALKSFALIAVGALLGYLLSELSRPGTSEPENKIGIENLATTPPPSRPDQQQANNPEAQSSPTNPELHPNQDFAARYRQLLQLPNGPEKVRSIKELFEQWGAAEGEAAYRYAKSLTGRDHLAYLASAAKGWARLNPRDAWDAMTAASNGGAMLVDQLSEVLGELASRDPLLATDYLFELESDYNRNRLFRHVIEHAQTNEERTRLLDHLLSYKVDGQNYLVQSLFRDWGRYNSEEPLARLALIEDTQLARQAMLGILAGWATADGRGAFEYALQSGDPHLLNNALTPIAKEWASSSTADEIRDLVQLVSDQENSDSIIKGIVSTLARADPELALESIMSLDDETARSNHTRDALSIWASSNLDDAEAYYMTLPPGQTKSYAIWGLFNPAMHQGSPPSRIMVHVTALKNPESIERALYSMTEYTKSVDFGDRTDALAAEIESYVGENEEISAEMRAKILENLGKGDG